MWRYMGPSCEVRAHVRLLQNAMLQRWVLWIAH